MTASARNGPAQRAPRGQGGSSGWPTAVCLPSPVRLLSWRRTLLDFGRQRQDAADLQGANRQHRRLHRGQARTNGNHLARRRADQDTGRRSGLPEPDAWIPSTSLGHRSYLEHRPAGHVSNGRTVSVTEDRRYTSSHFGETAPDFPALRRWGRGRRPPTALEWATARTGSRGGRHGQGQAQKDHTRQGPRDETVDDGKDKTSGSIWGSIVGPIWSDRRPRGDVGPPEPDRAGRTWRAVSSVGRAPDF